MAGFFSDTSGIYVEGTNGIPGRCRSYPVNWNQDWERETQFTFFEPDGAGGFERVLDQGAGVAIFGGCSRIYPQKSLELHARSRYGASDFAYRFFDGVDIESFDDLVLRSSAQDWWRTMFRDGMIQTVTRHMDLDGQAYRPALVFLNGEFWGIHNIREKLNEDWVTGHYGHPDDEVELIEGTWGAIAGGMRVVETDSRFDDALSWFGAAIDVRDGGTMDHQARPWTESFDRVLTRVPEADDAEAMIRDWVADSLWSLYWTAYGSFEQARCEMATRLWLLRRLAQEFVSLGSREDVATAEALMIVDLVGTSEWWEGITARLSEAD